MRFKVPRSGRMARRIARYVHWAAIVFAVGVTWQGAGVGLVLLSAALLVDWTLFKFKVHDDSTNLIVKLVLLSVCVVTLLSLVTSPSPPPPLQHSHGVQHHQHSAVHRNVRTHHTHGSKPKAARHSSAKKLVVSSGKVATPFPSESQKLLERVFEGTALPSVDFADLRYRSPEEVRSGLKRMFAELPSEGFLPGMKNPCWKADADTSKIVNEREAAALQKRRKALIRRGAIRAGQEEEEEEEEEKEEATEEEEGQRAGDTTHCLPYAYVLGQPKCGTSDLFERLKMHPEIKMPARKEVRWFTRGEFTRSFLDLELPHNQGSSKSADKGVSNHQLLGPGSSIYSFTKSFHNTVKALLAHPSTHVTIDGGPHTLWWPTQSPDGTVIDEAIPTQQIIREMQPNAKFIITLADPVKRTYSDYYFLDDNLRVHKPGAESIGGGGKSSRQFHERVVEQVESMTACIEEQVATLSSAKSAALSSKEHQVYWFRASQICAHDRHRFAQAGWGRLAIGMYAEFYEKWLEHFPPSQFLVLRLEDYDKDPTAYMEKIFAFLELSEPSYSDWSAILNKHKANEYHAHRDPILPETETLLREFYKPHNEILSLLLGNDERFLWDSATTNLHEAQVAADKSDSSAVPDSVLLAKSSSERDAGLVSRKMQVLSEKKAAVKAKQDHESIIHSWRKNYEEKLHEPFQKDLAWIDRLAGMKKTLDKVGHSNHDDDDDKNDAVTAEVMRKDKYKHPAEKKKNKKKMRDKKKGKLAANLEYEKSLQPQPFSLEGLPLPESEEFNQWLRDGKYIDRQNPIVDEQDAAEQLCLAAFALDLAALKYLLYDKGVPANLVYDRDARRNAFHCLALIHIMADAHGKSQVFATIKGRPNWLAQYIDPPLPKQSHTVLARDVVDGTSAATIRVAQWLVRAGCPVDLADTGGNSPLHHAVTGGMLQLATLIVAQGADVTRRNREGRTPLHYACSYGHAAVAGVLFGAGAGLDVPDKFGTTPRHIAEAPGPIFALDALKYLNVTQRSARTIHRHLHPELQPPGAKGGWRAGTGGWGTDRLKGYESDMSCDIDQYWAHEITGDELFEKYLSRMSPVLIRGLIDDWDATYRYSHENLTAEHGQLRVQVSDIPYSEKFGSSQRQDMKLHEYIEEMRNHRIKGGKHPWYVFKGNRIPVDSEKTDSLVQYSWTPTPHVIQHAIEYINPPTTRGYTGPKSREVFINAQWAFGGEGTGAPVHYHNTAWNALVYGAKKWIVYPPHSMIMSNRQIKEYFETDLPEFEARGVHSLSCVQTAGDVMIIPEIWGHGVLNLQESVAVATESKANHWRIKPASEIISKLPAPRQ